MVQLDLAMSTITISPVRLLFGCIVLTATSCGVDVPAPRPGTPGDPGSPSGDPGNSDPGQSDPGTPAAPGPDDSTPKTYTETVLTVMTRLTITPGNGADIPAVAKLDITARDGITPVITDLWLYNLDELGAPVALTGFTSTAARKSPRLMLPATVRGQPSQLTPADDGRMNGVMTNTSRGTMKQGAFVSGVTGTVTVTLPAVPTQPILVVAGVEDQRYAGAAVINADGTPGAVPDGVPGATPQVYTRLSFARDIAPITEAHCGGCHKPTHTYMSRPAGTRDDLVNNNFGMALATRTCQRTNPDGGVALDQCIQGITSAVFLVEPGVPAGSPLLTRTRPDEDGNASANGLAWWGAQGARYNMTYGDQRMPSTIESTDPTLWTAQPTDFDLDPASYQQLWNWVAQGAAP